MQIARHLNDLPFDLLNNGSAVTIGSYDGVHIGHQKLLDTVLEKSAALSVPSVVMSFEPTPKEYFSADEPPARLMCFREKYEALERYGIDLFFCPRFGDSMRDIAVDTFIRQVLIHGINTRALIIGDDFRFAKSRAGGIAELRRAGRALDMQVSQLESVDLDGERVSSSKIRAALQSGQLDRAARLLGKPYRMSGRVIEGRKLGRKLGYPTANVNLNRKQSAVMGIYAARIEGVEDSALDAVVSIGTRPTFHLTKPLLEVHIFDFDGDIYKQRIHVDFIKKLRDEVKFANVEDLVAQMHKDEAEARAVLAA